MRKSFWDLATEFAGYENELWAIIELFENRSFSPYGMDSVSSARTYIELYCFSEWVEKHPVTFTSLSNLMQRLGLDDLERRICFNQEITIDKFLLYLEVVYNLLNMKTTFPPGMLEIRNRITHAIEIDCARLNFEVRRCGDEQYIIVEKNAAATAVADKYAASDLDFSFKVIEYNHFLLKGNIDRKREILLALGQKYEPMHRQLEAGPFKNVSEDARALLNNLNIRHDNISPEDKTHYNANVAQMPASDLEEWYDRTYDILLLALLAEDFSKVHKAVEELKRNFGNK